MILDSQRSLLERIESEIEASKQRFSVRIDELPEEEEKYEDVLQCLLDEVRRAFLPEGSLSSYFERAKRASRSNEIPKRVSSELDSIKSEMEKEKKQRLIEQSKKVKERVLRLSSPIAEIKQKIVELELEFEQQKNILNALEAELAVFKDAVERQRDLLRPLSTITKRREAKFREKQKEIEPKIEEASFKLGEIAMRLWCASLEYDTKISQYALSVMHNEEVLEQLLEEWSKAVEHAEKVGFLSHCSEHLSAILIGLWSRIRTVISNCKHRILSTDAEEKKGLIQLEKDLLNEIVNDAECWRAETPEFDKDISYSNKMH